MTALNIYYNLKAKKPLFKNTNTLRKITILTTIVFTLSCNTVSANESHLVINGKSIHSKERTNNKYNEQNFGLGFQYDFTEFDKKLIPLLHIGGFSDSNKNPSYYFGGGLSHRTKFRNGLGKYHIDAGISFFFMSRVSTSKTQLGQSNVSPGALPMLSIGSDTTALNISYIPKIESTDVNVWFFQLKIKLF